LEYEGNLKNMILKKILKKYETLLISNWYDNCPSKTLIVLQTSTNIKFQTDLSVSFVVIQRWVFIQDYRCRVWSKTKHEWSFQNVVWKDSSTIRKIPWMEKIWLVIEAVNSYFEKKEKYII